MQATLIFILIGLRSVLGRNENPVIHLIEENPGIAFHQIEKIAFNRENWSILTIIDLQYLTNLAEQIDDVMDELDKFIVSENITFVETSSPFQFIKDNSKDMHRADDSLNRFVNTLSVDKIKGGGRAMSLQNSYAVTNFNQAIKDMNTLRAYELAIMAGQDPNTYFFDNTVEQQIKALNDKQSTIKKYIQKLQQKLSKDRKEMAATLHKTVALIKEVLQEGKELTLTIVEMFKYNKYLFSTHLIQAAVHDVEKLSSLHSIVKASAVNSANIAEVGQLHFILYQKILIVEIVWPLIDAEQFTVYKILPFPAFQISKSNKVVSAYIKPQSDYIVISENNSSHFFMSQSVFESCKAIKYYKICNFELIENTGSSCEYNLLVKPKLKALYECDIQVNQSADHFVVQTASRHLWLFSVQENDSLKIKCESKIVSIPKQSTGIIEVPRTCNIWAEGKIYRGAGGTHHYQRINIPELQLTLFKIDQLLETKEFENKEITVRATIPTLTEIKSNCSFWDEVEGLAAIF